MQVRLSREGALVVVALLLACLFLAAGRRGERLLPGEDLARVELLTQDIENEREEILERVARKRRIAWKLIAGQVTLLEAASQYKSVNESDPRFYWDGFRVAHAGVSDEERHCHEAIERAEGELEATDPCLALALRARLLGELEKWKAQAGGKK